MNNEMIKGEIQWFTLMYSIRCDNNGLLQCILSGVTIMNKEMIEVEMQWFTSMYSIRCDNNLSGVSIMNEMIEVK